MARYGTFIIFKTALVLISTNAGKLPKNRLGLTCGRGLPGKLGNGEYKNSVKRSENVNVSVIKY